MVSTHEAPQSLDVCLFFLCAGFVISLIKTVFILLVWSLLLAVREGGKKEQARVDSDVILLPSKLILFLTTCCSPLFRDGKIFP
jgi:hypothetical protein